LSLGPQKFANLYENAKGFEKKILKIFFAYVVVVNKKMTIQVKIYFKIVMLFGFAGKNMKISK
jgi:hypothetical protein